MDWNSKSSWWPSDLTATIKQSLNQYLPAQHSSELSQPATSAGDGHSVWVNLATGAVVIVTGVTALACVKSLLSMALWQRSLRKESTSERYSSHGLLEIVINRSAIVNESSTNGMFSALIVELMGRVLFLYWETQ